jgi:hypothetical protein
MLAEPTAKTISKVKCGNIEGYAPLDIMDEYFEGTAKVVDKFKVKHSFVKVPDYMREAAKRAVEYADENGWGDCGTEVGKKRANDLADPNYDASLDILTRMYSYGSRHKKDFESSKSFDDGCGALMMASWSFTPSNYDQAMSWLERQIKNATEENMKFSSDEFRGDITSVVFEPETYIYRYDKDTQTPYYVFMSKETIRKMLMKLSRLKEMGKITNIINYEHSGMIFNAADVYTYENWIVGEDPKKDKSYEIFGREMKPGTWITTIHFKDKRLFDDFILSNKTTGVSLEGNFFEIPFNFKSEEFIEPKLGQTKDEYIAECIPYMIKEGYAEDQSAAVCYSKWKERFAAGDKVSFDYHDTLNTARGQELYKKELESGSEIYVISAAQNKDDLTTLTDKLGIDRGKVFATGSNTAKIEKIKELGITRHYDNNVDVIDELGSVGEAFADLEEACWEGYEPIGLKNKDGRYVPNCVPIKAAVDTSGMIDYLQPDEDDLLDKEVFKPYDWDKCIADQEKAYGSKEIAQKVCGKIRSENMALLGVVEGAPVYPTKEEADQKAKQLGCEGSHEMTGYGFTPCKTHSEAAELYNAEVLVYLLEDLLNKME